jgi:coiled-coil domain-containing protein 130
MQGFNMGRYVPPDLEGLTSGNKVHGKHALGARANKIGQGILTVRFEMPFAIWCDSCPKPTIIGQGVRFNAEKKKIGNYYSTPIWSFRMKHADCGGAIEMHTDPKNTTYVVAYGAKKRDTGEDKEREGDFVITTDREREVLRNNAFASLEKTIKDRQQLAEATERLTELEAASSAHWDDPFTRNQRLRREFRIGRKERENEATSSENLKSKMSLGIELLPGTEEDTKRAALVDFGAATTADTSHKALSKPLFNSKGTKNRVDALIRSKPTTTPLKRKEHLAFEVSANTRLKQDPFLFDQRSPATSKRPNLLSAVKRKRTKQDEDRAEETVPLEKPPSVTSASSAKSVLVNYDSD